MCSKSALEISLIFICDDVFYAKISSQIADIYTHSHFGFSWDEPSHLLVLDFMKDSWKENFIFNALFWGLPLYNPRIVYHGSPWKPLDIEC